MIVIKRKDGGTSIMRPVGNVDVAEEIEKWKSVHPDEYVSHKEVPDSNIRAKDWKEA